MPPLSQFAGFDQEMLDGMEDLDYGMGMELGQIGDSEDEMMEEEHYEII